IAPQKRARTGNCQMSPCYLPAKGIVENDVGRADFSPRLRRRVDQVAQRVVPALSEPQKQPRRQTRRRPRIGLRLVAVGEDRVENMRAKAGLGGVSAGAMTVAEQRVQPAVALAALGKVVDKLDVAMPITECARQFVEVEG